MIMGNLNNKMRKANAPIRDVPVLVRRASMLGICHWDLEKITQGQNADSVHLWPVMTTWVRVTRLTFVRLKITALTNPGDGKLVDQFSSFSDEFRTNNLVIPCDNVRSETDVRRPFVPRLLYPGIRVVDAF